MGRFLPPPVQRSLFSTGGGLPIICWEKKTKPNSRGHEPGSPSKKNTFPEINSSPVEHRPFQPKRKGSSSNGIHFQLGRVQNPGKTDGSWPCLTSMDWTFKRLNSNKPCRIRWLACYFLDKTWRFKSRTFQPGCRYMYLHEWLTIGGGCNPSEKD